MAGLIDKHDRHWNGSQVFAKNATVQGNLGVTGTATITGATTATGAITAGGAVTISGQLDANGALTVKATQYNYSGTAQSHAAADGNVLLLNSTSACTVNLPSITEALDGFILKAKKIGAGTAAIKLKPVSPQKIEDAAGTYTATSATLTSAGAWREFVADYNATSAGQSIWYQIGEKLT